MEERHLSLSDAAAALNISERSAYRWIKSGKLRAYKPGRDYWIPESAIRAVVEESEVNSKKARALPSLETEAETALPHSELIVRIEHAPGEWLEAFERVQEIAREVRPQYVVEGVQQLNTYMNNDSIELWVEPVRPSPSRTRRKNLQTTKTRKARKAG